MEKKSDDYKIGFTGNWRAVDPAVSAALDEARPLKDIVNGAFAAFTEGRTEAFAQLYADSDTAEEAGRLLKSDRKNFVANGRKVAEALEYTQISTLVKNLAESNHPRAAERSLLRVFAAVMRERDTDLHHTPVPAERMVLKQMHEGKHARTNALNDMMEDAVYKNKPSHKF